MKKRKISPRELTAIEKVILIDELLDSLDKPYLVLVKHKEDEIACRALQSMPTKDYCELIASFMITTAQLNGLTPIKLLSAVGQTMSELMERQEKQRKDNVTKETEKAHRG